MVNYNPAIQKKLERSNQYAQKYSAAESRSADAVTSQGHKKIERSGRYFQVPVNRLNKLRFADASLAQKNKSHRKP